MMFDECTKEELQLRLQHNKDAQMDILNGLQRADAGEEDILKKMNADSKETELLCTGWTGDAAKKYVLRAQEENETFRKRYMIAFSQERERLYEEQKRLRLEEQDLSEALAKQNDKQKE